MSSIATYSQILDSKQTIDYINTKYDKGIQLDSIGNIAIAKEIKFNYRDVVLSPKSSSKYIEFQCKYVPNGCIERLTNSTEKRINLYRINIENTELYYRLYNAFDNLMKVLQKERPELKDTDPFAPHNYNKVNK